MKRSVIIALSFLVLAQLSLAQVAPQTISYQGVLRDKTTGELVDDTKYITFNIYDSDVAVTPVWTSELQSILVTNGIFQVKLGSATKPLPESFPSQAWLGIMVAPDTEELPLIELTAVPYSLQAGSVSGTSNVFPGSGSVGIGTTAPIGKLHIVSPNSDGIVFTDSITGTYRATLLNFDTYGGQLNLNDAADGFIKAKIRGYATVDGYQASFTAGNVGIGTATPTAALEVVGGIKADSIQLATAAERWYAIPAPEFRHAQSSTQYGNAYYVYTYSSGNFYAPAHLPHGATITGFEFTYTDNDSVNVNICLYSVYRGNQGVSQIAGLTTSGEVSTVQTISDMELSQPVDNQNYTYMVQAFWTTATYGPDIKIHNARIKYTVTQPLP